MLRNQLAGVPGAAVPQPFGGRWREIMLYVDPYKLEARQMSLMDVVRAMNDSNLILPAGDVQIGRFDYNIYANSQVSKVDDINDVPIKLSGDNPVRVSDIGIAKTPTRCSTTLCAWTANAPSICRCSSRAATRTPSRWWMACARS